MRGLQAGGRLGGLRGPVRALGGLGGWKAFKGLGGPRGWMGGEGGRGEGDEERGARPPLGGLLGGDPGNLLT